MTRAARWVAGIAGSVAAHAGLLAVLSVATDPDPVENQPLPSSQLEVDAYQVERTEAPQAEPESTAAATEQATGAQISQGAIQKSRADVVDPNETSSAVADIKEFSSAKLSSSVINSPTKTSASPQPIKITQHQPESLTLAAQPRPVLAIAPAETPQQAALAAPPDSAAVAPTAPPASALPDTAPPSETVPQQTPPAEKATAALAFSSDISGDVDPVSVAAIQSFMQPGDLNSAAGTVRDGIAGLLSQVPCARLQVGFVPETGTLQLNGHIPETGLRAPVLAALQAQIGQDITVSDNLLILPRPQCGALAGIASVGLAQSTDQITNPLLIGDDTHAREFRYTAGQRLILDLSAPDYDAYVYVDYFDADGQVIHLTPNEVVPLTPAPAKSALQVGSDQDGAPALNITIGPPYGQEIAVAFAASVPLYDGVRPLVEPAEPYLQWMQARVTAAREAHADFKGEWVYFFISTQAQ